MTEISASTVMKLRKISGQGMMDCKKALQEANGDIEQAMEVLRKKGLATLARRAERETSEGTIVAWESEDGKWGGLVVLCCETDFVAKSDDFIQLAEAIRKGLQQCDANEGGDRLLETTVDGKRLSDMLTEVAAKTGEKIQLVKKECEIYHLDDPGLIKTYLHFNGKVGAMVEIETDSETTAASEALRRAASDIAMHIAATKPLALDENGIDATTIEKEKAIFAEQAKNKPANIIEKIVEGKMKKFYAENCLLRQLFVKDDSKTIAQVVAGAAKQAGGEAKIKRFVRFEVG